MVLSRKKIRVRPQGGFLGVNYPYSTARVVLLPVPWEKTASYRRGTRLAPSRIILASEQVEFFDEELGLNTSQVGIHTAPFLVGKGGTPERMCDLIAGKVAKARAEGKFPVIIGGEHTISVGAVRGMLPDKDLTVLYFDAHPDLRGSYQGEYYSHACTARRIWEMRVKLVIVGARTFSEEENDFVRENPLPIFWARDLIGSTRWIDKLISSLRPNVYISVDLDGFDPSIFPAVGTPEPGGVGWYEFLEMVRRVADNRRIVGFDVVELCPQPNQEQADFAAARLIYRLIGYALGKEVGSRERPRRGKGISLSFRKK